jgi:uncharacterized protein (TIGR00299 family) protein
VEAVSLRVEAVQRGGLGATRVHVDAAGTDSLRTWQDVRALLDGAELDEPVRATAMAVFGRLAEAEAAVHRVPVDEVHFHEVGALDALADVVGTAAGLHHLGLTALTASTVSLGSGSSRGAHGPLPVPAPAVLALLAGAPVRAGAAPHEMTTPTGAAILATVVTGWGELPSMTVHRVGMGAGGRDVPEVANVLRLAVGELSASDPAAPGALDPAAPDLAAPDSAAALVLETNVDDLDPRLWPLVLQRLLEVGASDAWLTPIVMKKGRPAHMLSVLCSDAAAEAVRRVVFTETSTIGLRTSRVDKHALGRSETTVTVDGQLIRVKLAVHDGSVVNANPEYDDVEAAAGVLGRPVKAVLAEAAAAAQTARKNASAPA